MRHGRAFFMRHNRIAGKRAQFRITPDVTSGTARTCQTPISGGRTAAGLAGRVSTLPHLLMQSLESGRVKWKHARIFTPARQNHPASRNT